MYTVKKENFNCSLTLKDKIYKNLTLALFCILPSKIANIFVSFSILAIIYKLRNLDFCKEKINTDKVQRLLQITVNDNILIFPNYTLYWFWNEEFLNRKTVIDGNEYSLKYIIMDSKLFFKHIRLVVNLFVSNLPKLLQYKLNINNLRNKIVMEHNLVHILIYS